MTLYPGEWYYFDQFRWITGKIMSPIWSLAISDMVMYE